MPDTLDRSHLIGEAINLGTTSLSPPELPAPVVRSMNQDDLPVTYVNDRPGQRRLPGWAQQVGFEMGLQRITDCYIANRPWWEEQLWMRDSPMMTKTGRRELN